MYLNTPFLDLIPQKNTLQTLYL